MNEIEAINEYHRQHATCDIQRHHWQAVFGAGYAAGRAEYDRLRAALQEIAEQNISFLPGDHRGAYEAAIRMRGLADTALDRAGS